MSIVGTGLDTPKRCPIAARRQKDTGALRVCQAFGVTCGLCQAYDVTCATDKKPM